MGSYLVLTDMHFGTSETQINKEEFRLLLTNHIASFAPWEEIVLAGDLLDANLSTLERAIEGDSDSKLCGFRKFLEGLHQAAAAKGGLACVAKRWVYVPGNHDYKIWDMLSSKVAFEDVIASGDIFGKKIPLPLQRYAWTGERAFIAGIWKGDGYDARANVDVEYPDHRIAVGPDEIVVTHGHYLDASQTRFNDLYEVLRLGRTPAEVEDFVRGVFIETAQYQTVANAISFRKDTKSLADAVFGEAGIGNKVKKLFNKLGERISRLFFRPNGNRGAAVSASFLRNVDSYLAYFQRLIGPQPRNRWFVFGHTHAQGQGLSPEGVSVWNAGSCYQDNGKPITFLEINVVEGQPVLKLRGIARDGTGWAVV